MAAVVWTDVSNSGKDVFPMSDDAFSLQTKSLDSLVKALKENLKRARVGILGNGNARGSKSNKAPGNAEIASHSRVR